MPNWMWRVWMFAGGIYACWWSYRLFTNPFVACEHPDRKISGRVISSLCESKHTDVAGVVVAVLAMLLFAVACWPRRRGDA